MNFRLVEKIIPRPDKMVEIKPADPNYLRLNRLVDAVQTGTLFGDEANPQSSSIKPMDSAGKAAQSWFSNKNKRNKGELF